MTTTRGQTIVVGRRMISKSDSNDVVLRLNELVGMHPDGLQDLYLSATPFEKAALGTQLWCGNVLAFIALKSVFAATQLAFRFASHHMSPWTGMKFDEGQSRGTNVFGSAEFLRIRPLEGTSLLDGKKTLNLRYDAVNNPWPTRGLIDELRLVRPGLIIGGTFREGKVTTWFGLSADPQ